MRLFFLPFYILTCFALQAQQSVFQVEKIIIKGNKTTKDFVILNELPVKEGDTVSAVYLDKLKTVVHDNVFNTGLFNYVYVSDSILGNHRLILKIRVEERWYIWPYPILEHGDINFTNFLLGENWYRVNYGMMLMWYNFRGRRDYLKLKVRKGYKQQYGFMYHNPYFLKNRDFSYSIGANFNIRNEIPGGISDDHILKYISSPDQIYKNYYAGFSLGYRPDIYNFFTLSFSYNNSLFNAVVCDSVCSFSRDTEHQYGDLFLSYTLDRRNIKFYTTKGYYLSMFSDFRSQRNGLSGFFLRYAKLDVRKFTELGRRLFLSNRFFANRLFVSNDNFLITDLDYWTGNNIRGFPVYAYPVNLAFQSSIKYNVLPQKVMKLNFIKSYKFNKPFLSVYAGMFADAGYCTDTNDVLYSYGLTLEVITYYDKLLRIETGFNSMKNPFVSIEFVAAF